MQQNSPLTAATFDSRERICLAFDGMDLDPALRLCKALGPRTRACKANDLWVEVGGDLSTYMIDNGANGVWADVKTHDVPSTMTNTGKKILRAEAAMWTIHASSGVASMKAAREVYGGELLVVTLLTSIGEEECKRIYNGRTPGEQVLVFAEMAHEAGIRSLVCSGEEAEAYPVLAERFRLTIPGVRSAGASKGTQKRVVTPLQAFLAGATHIVLGSEVTGAEDPIAKFEQIVADIKQGLPA